MADSRAQTTEVTRLRVREFDKIIVGSGTRLLKCEVCGRLTDKGLIIDRDIVEDETSGHLQKTGYERWILCQGCAQNVIGKIKSFTEELIKEIQESVK